MTLSSYLKWIYKTSTSIACGIEWNNLNNAYFRGHADKKWELKPSLFRNNNLIYEHELFKKAQNTLWFELQNTKTHLERLIILQHHGLSTRLLDVTTNPLIALYFACLDNKNDKGEETDGVVYCSYYNDGSFNNNNIEKICEFINDKQPDEICSTLPKIVLKEEVNEDLLTTFVTPGETTVPPVTPTELTITENSELPKPKRGFDTTIIEAMPEYLDTANVNKQNLQLINSVGPYLYQPQNKHYKVTTNLPL
jgi:hypothetical protein